MVKDTTCIGVKRSLSVQINNKKVLMQNINGAAKELFLK